ncbi:MAG: hypothetical protein CL910_07410 [Deltaproteobacteria bacterium]|jgi:hypothetical protein|nr:hypothetical protein [Deltaproteobacteria bacterium]
MHAVLETILPREASNEYRGGLVPFYGFCLVAAVMLFRSTVHFLKDDSGVNSIASIILFEGSPDPNNLIYLFSSIGGVEQLLFVMVYGVVLWRYRNLIPLMFAFLVVESCFGFVVGALHPLDPVYYEHTPPGKLGAVPKLLFAVGMLALSVRNSNSNRQG